VTGNTQDSLELIVEGSSFDDVRLSLEIVNVGLSKILKIGVQKLVTAIGLPHEKGSGLEAGFKANFTFLLNYCGLDLKVG